MPTVDKIDQISALSDPIIRNLQITQCYYELSCSMRELLGGGANWCTFATWASKQAGQTIRREDLLKAYEALVDSSPEVSVGLDVILGYAVPFADRPDVLALRQALRRALNPELAFQRASDAVARGNRKVFEEIGREFARFVMTFATDDAFDAEKTARFCDALRPADPPDGQRLLKEAFNAYCLGRFHSDEKQKMELIFLANLLIGLHEQIRLQPEITEALNASSPVVEEVKRRFLTLLLPSFWLRIRHLVARLLRKELPLDQASERLAEEVRSLVRRLITGSFMVLDLPGGALHLGRDLQADFPEALRQITSPALKDVLARIDPTPGSLQGSGALDWSDFEDRMHFIADFFRSHHDRRSLFDMPFTPDQVAALKAGRRPAGRL